MSAKHRVLEKLCADNARDKALIRDFLQTVPADSVPASKLSVTIRNANLDLYASVSLEKPDRRLSVWFIVSSSGDAVDAPPTTIGVSQSNVFFNTDTFDRSSDANAHFARCMAFVPQ